MWFGIAAITLFAVIGIYCLVDRIFSHFEEMADKDIQMERLRNQFKLADQGDLNFEERKK